MDVLTNRVGRSEIKPGDHIYTYRAAFIYSHHGIFVGGNKVVHFSPERNSNSSTWICSDSSLCNKSGVICSSYPECGFRQPNSGVLRSCLDCFLGNGSLYRFKYGVTRTFFFAQVRGGTCSIAKSDPPEQVIHRALYLVQYGFGNYDVLSNNCESFALYCKTGLQVAGGKKKLGGQATSFLGFTRVAIDSSRLMWLISTPVGVAMVAAGSVLMYCMIRYANDFGVRKDVIKVAVEDLVENMGWKANEAYFLQMNSGIFVGENKVVHFTAQKDLNSSSWASSGSSLYNSMITCSSYPECGFRKPNSGVLRSCLDCFLRNGSLYRYEYGVSKSVFLAHVRGGTCSTAKSDPPEEVTRRALYLLQTGFGNYDLFQNNCEDFALYCKTGLVIEGKVKTEGSGQKKGNKLGVGVGASGQVSSVSSVFDATLEAIRYSTLKSLVPRATVMAAMYFLDRYAADIGVRDDVIKMAVEDLAVNMGWEGHHGEEADDREASKQDFITMNSAVLPILDGTNISEWSDQVQFYLGVWDLDLALRTEKPPAITYSSSAEENAIYKSWERSNRLSIMFMQMSIVDNIKSTLPECDSAKEFFNNVEERFRSVDKSLTGTMVAELTTMKFDGTHGMHEHIIEMTNLTTRLKALGMNVDELLLVQFIFNSLPPEYELIQIQYNTHMDKWNVNELTSILVQEEAKLKQQGHHSVHLVSQGATKIEVPEVNGPHQVIEVHEKRQNNVIEPPEVNGHEKRQNKVIEPPKVNEPVHKKRQHMNVQCYFCKKFGHIQKNCNKRRAWFEKKGLPYYPDFKPK